MTPSIPKYCTPASLTLRRLASATVSRCEKSSGFKTSIDRKISGVNVPSAPDNTPNLTTQFPAELGGDNPAMPGATK